MITVTRFKSFNENELRSSGQIMSDIFNSKRRWPLTILIFKQSTFSLTTGTLHTSSILFVSVLPIVSPDCSNCLSVLIYDLTSDTLIWDSKGFSYPVILTSLWIKKFICIKYIMFIIIYICFFSRCCLALSLLPMAG